MKKRSLILKAAGSVFLLFFVLGAGPRDIPPELEQGVRRFNEVLAEFNKHYYREVPSRDEIYASISGMLATLDPHSVHLPPEFFEDMKVDIQGEFGGLGIEVGMRDGQLTVISPLEDTPAWRAGILAEDKIVKINGESTAGKGLMECVHQMRGKIGTTVTISIMRKGWEKPRDFTITREKINIKSVREAKLVGERIGYLKLATFNEHTKKQVEEGMKNIVAQVGGLEKLRGLILDLRNNPGGPLDQAVSVADMFIRSGTIVSIRGRQPSQNESRYAHASGTYDGFPMIVLVNGGSASASEIVAGALMDHGRAVIMGTKTFGKGSVQTLITMSDGSGLKLTTAKYYTPSNKSIQEVGITPDVIVEALSPEQMEIMEKHKAEKRHLRREADLEGHFTNEEMGGAKQEEQEPELSPEEKQIMEKDYQLQRAIEMIDSWSIFQANNKQPQ